MKVQVKESLTHLRVWARLTSANSRRYRSGCSIFGHSPPHPPPRIMYSPGCASSILLLEYPRFRPSRRSRRRRHQHFSTVYPIPATPQPCEPRGHHPGRPSFRLHVAHCSTVFPGEQFAFFSATLAQYFQYILRRSANAATISRRRKHLPGNRIKAPSLPFLLSC